MTVQGQLAIQPAVQHHRTGRVQPAAVAGSIPGASWVEAVPAGVGQVTGCQIRRIDDHLTDLADR